MESYEKRMFKYVGDDCETAIRPDLDDGVRPLVLVVQDDGRKSVWMENGKTKLRPKGQGRVIMVSEFLCECHGRLSLSDDDANVIPFFPFRGHCDHKAWS